MYSDQSTRVRAYHGKGKGRGKGRGHHGGEDQHDHDNDDDNHVGDRREESAAERSYPVDDEAPRRRAYHGKGERRGQEGEDHHQTHHRAYHGKGRYGGKGKGKGRDDRDRYDPDYDRGESSRKKGGGTQKIDMPPPLSFAGSLVLHEPIKADSIDKIDEECSLCMEKLIYVAVGHCGHHSICWLCALRLRWLLNDRSCPMCKEELDTLVLVHRDQYDPSLSINDLIASKKRLVIRDKEQVDIYYGDKRIQKIFHMIRQYRCGFCTSWDGDGSTEAEREDKWAFHTLGDLRTHLRKQHSRDFCTICLNERDVFILEQYLYTTLNHGADIDRHCRHGDPDLRPPVDNHPSCDFCNPSGRNDHRFYSADQLKTHMRKNHFTCHLCESMGWRNEYYKDYFALYAHFSAAHYPCEHNDCLAKRFVVFKTDDDLKIHEVTEHTNFGVMSRAEKRANLRLDLGTSGGRSRKPGQRDDNPNPDTAENYNVKFCKPPRQFYNGPDESTALGQEYAALNAVTSDEEDDQNEASDPKRIKKRYPSRKDGHRYDPNWHGEIPEPSLPKPRTCSIIDADNTALPNAAPGGIISDRQEGPAVADEEEEEEDLMERGRRVLILEAVRIIETDPDGLGRVNGVLFKNKNAELMKACRVALGDINLHHLKDAAMEMRKEQSDEALDYFVETAAEVFSLAEGGMQKGAQLCAAMVLLLPIKGLRDRLVERMQVYGGDAILESTRLEHERQARSISPQPRSTASVTSRGSSQPPTVKLPDTPVPIPDGLLAGPHKRPSFIKALMAVLDADLGEVDEVIPPKQYTKLVQSVQQIDGIQTDTLAEMRNQLLAVVGSRKDLSWANAEMVIGLRPLAYRLLTPRPTVPTSSDEEVEEEYEYRDPSRRREAEEAAAASAAELQKGWDEFVQQARRVLHERFNMLELCYMSTYIHLAAGRLQSRGIERGVDDRYSYQEFPLLPGTKPIVRTTYNGQQPRTKGGGGGNYPTLSAAHAITSSSSSSSSSNTRQQGLWATRNPARLADPEAFPELPKIQPKPKSSQWNAGGKARKDIERMKGLERRYPLLVRPTKNAPKQSHEPELPGWKCPHCEQHNEPQSDTCSKCGLKLLVKKGGPSGGGGGSGGSKGGKRKKANAADKAMGRF